MDTFNKIVDGIASAAKVGTTVQDGVNKALAKIPGVMDVVNKVIDFFKNLFGGGFDLSAITKLFGK